MRDQEYNHQVVPTNNGFNLVPRDDRRGIIKVELSPFGMWDVSREKKAKGYGNYHYPHSIPMFKFRTLIGYSVDQLLMGWENPKENSKVSELSFWAKIKCQKSLNHPILREFKRIIEAQDPIVVAVHKKAFSTSPIYGAYDNIERMLKENNPYLLSDMTKYRAAIISALFGEYEAISRDWILSYSKDGSKHGALTKTLMNLPAGVSPDLTYSTISSTTLTEVIKTRIRLLAYVGHQQKWYKFEDEREKNLTIIKRSTDEDIVNSLKYMWKFFPDAGMGDFRRTKSILAAFSKMFDYPASWDKIDILGLSKRSVEYHRNQALRIRLEEEKFKRDMEKQAERMKILEVSNTKKPDIKLPDDPNIKFLDTYKAVKEEGNLMGHCIATYAERAVDGACHLFHIDYEGEMASVEVDAKAGFVRQSYGPRNHENSASIYGRKVLSVWAKDITEKGR